MPNISEFLKKKSSKSGAKKNDWDLSTIVAAPQISPARPQRRPGRGEDSPLVAKEMSIEQLVPENKTGHKVDTNRAQTRHKPHTQPDTNRAQTGHAAIELSTPSFETGHKVDTQPDTNTDTKWTQTAHKPDTNQGFSSLVGLQREITVLVYESCKSARAKITEPLTLEHVASSLNIRTGSVKTTFRRLEEKRILRRDGFKNGRGGWSRYELTSDIHRELLQLETEHKLNTNRAQSSHKLNTQPDTEPDTSASSSSSSVLDKDLKTTTTDEPGLFTSDTTVLSPEWQVIDISPLAELGFSQNHLVQLIRQNILKPEVVQESIYAFAFDLRVNGKGRELKSPPLNYFMGIVRKGNPYAAPENYLPPEQEAMQKYLASKKAIAAKKAALEQQLQDSEFNEWYEALGAEERKKIAPDYREGNPLYRAKLRNHFDESVWPTHREKVMAAISA